MLRHGVVLVLSFAAAPFASLAAQGADQGGAYSFRGGIVLFGCRRPDASGSGILAIARDGTGMETILRPTVRAWVVGGRIAPDGRRLGYSVIPKGRKRAEVWLLGMDGQRRKVSDDGTIVAWSPDGA